MQIYHYDPKTGEYLGSGIADESPLEPGVFLIPANATSKEPPAIVSGKVNRYQAGSWLTEDNPVPEPEPSPVILTEGEQIVALDREFAPRFAAIREAYVSALMNDDSATAAARVADKTALEDEYITRLEAIYSGG